MRQFDLFRNPDAKSARRYPYLVVLQSDLLGGMETVVVAPLAKLKGLTPVKRLTPTIEIDGKSYLIMIHELAAVARDELRKLVGKAAGMRDSITSAIDLVFFGF